MQTRAYDDPPSPTAKKRAVIDGQDDFAYLGWYERGIKVADIAWPDNWPETVPFAVMRAAGFEVVCK